MKTIIVCIIAVCMAAAIIIMVGNRLSWFENAIDCSDEVELSAISKPQFLADNDISEEETPNEGEYNAPEGIPDEYRYPTYDYDDNYIHEYSSLNSHPYASLNIRQLVDSLNDNRGICVCLTSLEHLLSLFLIIFSRFSIIFLYIQAYYGFP